MACWLRELLCWKRFGWPAGWCRQLEVRGPRAPGLGGCRRCRAACRRPSVPWGAGPVGWGRRCRAGWAAAGRKYRNRVCSCRFRVVPGLDFRCPGWRGEGCGNPWGRRRCRARGCPAKPGRSDSEVWWEFRCQCYRGRCRGRLRPDSGSANSWCRERRRCRKVPECRWFSVVEWGLRYRRGWGWTGCSRRARLCWWSSRGRVPRSSWWPRRDRSCRNWGCSLRDRSCRDSGCSLRGRSFQRRSRYRLGVFLRCCVLRRC